MNPRQRQGQIGERIARRFLERKGFRFHAKNCRTPYGELDLVMFDRDCLVFCEVKFRQNKYYGAPELAITRNKLLHLTRSIEHYLADAHWHGPCRLDVIAIRKTFGRLVIDHFQNCDRAA